MACGCGKKNGGVKVAPIPVYYLESEPEGEQVSLFIQSTIRVSTSLFNRIFHSGTNLILLESQANELISLDAPVVLV